MVNKNHGIKVNEECKWAEQCKVATSTNRRKRFWLGSSVSCWKTKGFISLYKAVV